MPSLALVTTLGAVSHITPRLLDELDPDGSLGLYVSFDSLRYRGAVELAGSLAAFVSQPRRRLLLGPQSLAQGTSLKAKRDLEKVVVASTAGNIVVDAEDIHSWILQRYRPSICILPNPTRRRAVLCPSARQLSDGERALHGFSHWAQTKDQASWDTLAPTLCLDTLDACGFIAKKTEFIRSERIARKGTGTVQPLDAPMLSGPLPDATPLDIALRYKHVFIPFASESEEILSRLTASEYGGRTITVVNSCVRDVFCAFKNGFDVVITDLASSLAMRGLGIAVPLSPPSLDAASEPAPKQGAAQECTLFFAYSSAHALDKRPILPDCTGPCCKRPAAYIRHLYTTHELTGVLLVTAHNVCWLRALAKRFADKTADGYADWLAYLERVV